MKIYKTLYLFLYLLFNIGIIYSLDAQTHTSNSIAIGGDYISPLTFSIKGGIVWNKYKTIPGGGIYNPTHDKVRKIYPQVNLRYNILESALGIQPLVAYSYRVLGGRLALNAEYGFRKKKPELSILILLGLDLNSKDLSRLFEGRGMSILIGPSFNLTKNLNDNLLGFTLSIEFPIGKPFNKTTSYNKK